jgi:hypothetical protein
MQSAWCTKRFYAIPQDAAAAVSISLSVTDIPGQ